MVSIPIYEAQMGTEPDSQLRNKPQDPNPHTGLVNIPRIVPTKYVDIIPRDEKILRFRGIPRILLDFLTVLTMLSCRKTSQLSVEL